MVLELSLVYTIKSDKKDFNAYRYVRSKNNNKVEIGAITAIRDKNGKLAKSDEESACYLNEAFQSVFIRDTPKLLNIIPTGIENDVVTVEEFTSEESRAVVKDLEKSKAG